MSNCSDTVAIANTNLIRCKAVVELQHIHIMYGLASIAEAALGCHPADLGAAEVDEGVSKGCWQVSAHVL